MPMKQVAARLGVSVGSVHLWTRDIVLAPEHHARNLRGPQRPEHIAKRVASLREVHRRRRVRYQEHGRERARQGDALHQAGCMLYWAEGSKNRNSVSFANSDVEMVRFFCRFLRTAFDLSSEDLTIRINAYTGNGMTLAQIETWWLEALDLPRSSLRKGIENHLPTSSSGKKKNKLPYGVCSLRVNRSTWLVQHIYGAIQEYAGFDEPRWLDCTPRRSAATRPA